MNRNRLVIVIALVLLALTISFAPLLAHEGREVGEYSVVFGWRNEPAIAGVINGPEVFIEAAHSEEATAEADHDDEEANPFEGIEINLQVEVTFGDQSMTLPLYQAFGEPGHFIADLIPALPGDYTFHLTGNIGDIPVDETFSSADGQFSTVEPASDITFPSLDAVGGDAAARIEALEARIAALEALVAEIQAGQ